MVFRDFEVIIYGKYDIMNVDRSQSGRGWPDAAVSPSILCCLPMVRQSLSRSPDNAAGDLCSGISCRLGGEIIRLAVDDDGAPQDLVNGKALVVEGDPGVTLISLEREHITCMGRMEAAGRIEMLTCVDKIIAAIAGLVDMHGIKAGGAWSGFVRKVKELGLNEDACIGSSVEFYKPADGRGLCAASHPGKSGGSAKAQDICKYISRSHGLVCHSIHLKSFILYRICVPGKKLTG